MRRSHLLRRERPWWREESGWVAIRRWKPETTARDAKFPDARNPPFEARVHVRPVCRVLVEAERGQVLVVV